MFRYAAVKKKKMLYEPKTILFYLKNWDKSNRTFCTISGIEIIDSLGFLFHGQRIPGTCIQAVKRRLYLLSYLILMIIVIADELAGEAGDRERSS